MKTKKNKIIEELCAKKANENNSIDLNAYAIGLSDMYDKIHIKQQFCNSVISCQFKQGNQCLTDEPCNAKSFL